MNLNEETTYTHKKETRTILLFWKESINRFVWSESQYRDLTVSYELMNEEVIDVKILQEPNVSNELWFIEINFRRLNLKTQLWTYYDIIKKLFNN